MKIKTSYLVYAVIATVFAGLSMFTDIFEKGNFEAIFSNLGMIIGLSISAYILITMAKSFIDLVINELKNQEIQHETIETTEHHTPSYNLDHPLCLCRTSWQQWYSLQCYGCLSCSLLCFSSLLSKERKSHT